MVDYNNYKPYRTKAQKAEARRTAVKCADGTWRSKAPVSYHHDRGSSRGSSMPCKQALRGSTPRISTN